MPKKKILVVDDEIAITKLLKLVLERTAKFEVYAENQGSRAMKTASEVKPDLILLDVNLSDENGGELSERFSKDASLKQIPIIFLTGAISPTEVESGMGTLAGRPVVAKPINMEKLVAMMEKYLKN